MISFCAVHILGDFTNFKICTEEPLTPGALVGSQDNNLNFDTSRAMKTTGMHFGCSEANYTTIFWQVVVYLGKSDLT